MKFILNFVRTIIQPFPGVARFYRNSRDLLDKNQPSIQTPWGFKFSGHPQMAAGSFEPEETKLVRDLLQEVDILVNVGANVGYYCCHALSLDKPVIAVEPIARNLHYLLRNITENGWAQQAEIFPVALGEQTDVLKMWGGGKGASLIKGWAGIPESYVTAVPVLTLDRVLGDALRDKKALILVDVEGAEYAMLQGAMKTLRHDPKPIWMVEIASTTHQPEGVAMNPYLVPSFELFFEYGYKADTADHLRKPVDSKHVRAVADGHAELETHNFIFSR